MGAEPLGDIHIAILYRAVAWLAEFHLHHAGFAREGNDPDAHAHLYLGMVHYFVHWIARVRSVAPGLPAVDFGPYGRDELIYSSRVGSKRSFAKARRQIALAVEAPVLVLRPPRGIHCDS